MFVKLRYAYINNKTTGELTSAITPMDIIILGSICARCQKTFDKVSQVVSKSSLDATVRFETDVVKILDYNIRSLPAIVVDDVVKMNGKVPTDAEVRKILNL